MHYPMRSRHQLPGTRVLIAIAGLALIAAVVLTTLLRNPVPDEMFAEPREVSESWLLSHLEFPGEEQARAMEASADPEAFDRFLCEYFATKTDLEGLPIGFLTSVPETIDLYHQGLLAIRASEPIPFELPLDWSRTDLGITFQAELHSWRILTSFLLAYQETGDRKYLEVLESIADDWIEKNPFDAPSHPRAWHEGAMAKRLLVLLNLFNHYKDAGPEGSSLRLRTILALIIQHAEYFAWGGDYRPAGNHGIRQDVALIAAAMAIPEAVRSSVWMQTAAERLRVEQVERGFSDDYVWLEASPAYHDYAIRVLDDLLRLEAANHTDIDLGFVHEVVEGSGAYLAYVLTPEGLFPPVGDSTERDTNMTRGGGSPEVRYAVSRSEEGSPPADLDGFFPDGGDAIFRDTWGDDPESARDAFYIHIHAAFHPGFGHRHADDLSFVMYGRGRWWILEGGKYGKDKNQWRKYCRSAQAHNGYTFDNQTLLYNEDYRGRDVEFENTLVSSDQLAAVRGTTNRFRPSNTSVTRTLIFLRDRSTLVLLDHLRSPRPGSWQQYLHLPPDVEVRQISPAHFLTLASTHPDLELEILSQADGLTSAEIVTGSEEPVQGWYSPEFKEMVPMPTAVIERQGAELVVATVIRVKVRGSASLTDLSAGAHGDEYHVQWREGGESVSIAVGAVAPLTVDCTIEPSHN